MRSYYHYRIMIIFRVLRRRPSVLDKMLFHDNISSRWSIIHSECLTQRSFTEWKLVLVLAIAVMPVSTQQTLRCKTTCFCVLCQVNCCSSDFDEAFGTTEILQKIPLWKHVVLLCESYRLWQKSSQKRDIRIVPFFIFHPSWTRRGCDRMVVGFTTTYVISVYHHWCWEFESRSGLCVQHYVIKFVCDLWQVGGFLLVLRFSPPIKRTTTI